MASTFSVVLTFRARKDMDNICIYMAERLSNPAAASRFSDGVTSSAKSLSSFPKRYRVRKKNRKGQEIRYMPFGNFVIMYYVDDASLTVNVIRVVYAGRNIDAMI
ncbi:MAG: type II toxin-antitoxin system RelE/ParE family toxin [Synergistaceae bacterium]|nr:type II toxin-antitoxin system RelE/ParE family toxin [Synergistaceae bacterium]